MVKLLVGRDGRVDLETPIYVDGETREQLIAFLKRILPIFETKHVDEPLIEQDVHHDYYKRWTKEELLFLLEPGSNEEKARLFEERGPAKDWIVDVGEISIPLSPGGRKPHSIMGVAMKRGSFYPEYLEWLRRKGLLHKESDPTVREQFVDEALSE